MFIKINETHYSKDFIAYYQNRWKRLDKGEYEKNGAVIVLKDGNRICSDFHIEDEEARLDVTVIPAYKNCVMISAIKNEKGDDIEIMEEPIIAWEIEHSWVTPITPFTSADDYHNYTHGCQAVRIEGNNRLYSRDCAWDNLESFKEQARQRLIKAE